MEATELKIRNWINDQGRIMMVSGIPTISGENEAIELCRVYRMTEKTVTLGSLLPIPLTEEWLLRFGFEKKEPFSWKGNGADYQPETSKTEQIDFVLNDFFVRFEKRCYRKDENSEWICEDSIQLFRGLWYNDSREDRIPCNPIQYVHQLQNLYLDLTGEDLEIKQAESKPVISIKEIVLKASKSKACKSINYLHPFDDKKIDELCDYIERIIKGEKISLRSPSYLQCVQIAGPMPKIQRETIRDIMFTIGIKGETAHCSTIIADEINKQ
jgi:hypothetical protein